MDREGLSAHSVLKSRLWLALGVVLVVSTACTSVFFQPSKRRFPFAELDRLTFDVITLESKGGRSDAKIKAWMFSSVINRRTHPDWPKAANLKEQEVRGVALQFHGNAENMSSHYRFMQWLLPEGWDVITFDYRGYGDSEGESGDLSGTLADGKAALAWANSRAEELGVPLVIFGQSLGGNIALKSLLAPDAQTSRLKLVVIDSSFYSFQSIAREKLSDVWFLWPLQPLAYLLVANTLSAGPELQTPAASSVVAKWPALFLHSKNDPVVSFRQGQLLYEAYPGEKAMWTTDEPGHVNTLFAEAPGLPHRQALKQRLRALQPSKH